MDKLTMAHEYAIEMAKQGISLKSCKDLGWKYADAMQAEADKRVNMERPDVLKASNSGELEWQPDWSQAPDNATHWAMDGRGQCNWYEREPEVCGSQWDWGGVIDQADTSYDYQGNWQDSLRKRPQ